MQQKKRNSFYHQNIFYSYLAFIHKKAKFSIKKTKKKKHTRITYTQKIKNYTHTYAYEYFI